MPYHRIYLIIVVILLLPQRGISQWLFDVEGDYIVSIPYNTVRIPSNGGTKIDLAKDLDATNTITFRGRVSYIIKERHVISALVAPLTIRSSGSIGQDVRYSDGFFAANTNINATYKFNSYRLTYRYIFVFKEHLKVGAGLTGKIRDANITLKNESGSADYPDLGFVPLINLYFHWKPADGWGLLLEGDALGTKQGRAEDIFAGITLNVSPNTEIKGGYRLLEGGADVTNNYNFTFINYIAVGAIIKL